MSQEYWNKVHSEKYSKEDWAQNPSIFARDVIKFFPKTGKILELGAGQGGDAAFFKSLGYEVVATDFSDEALKLTKERFKGIEFIKLDTSENLPFKDEMFDVVYSHMSIHYFDEKTTNKVMKEIYRVLKNDGIFAAITNTMDDPEKETFNYTELETGFYHDPKGINKRYFSVESMKKFTEGLFVPILLDNKGETHKDDIYTLIRFIGKKSVKK